MLKNNFSVPHGTFQFQYANDNTKLDFRNRVRIYFPDSSIFDQNLPDIADPLVCPYISPPQQQWSMAAFLCGHDPRLWDFSDTIKHSVIQEYFNNVLENKYFDEFRNLFIMLNIL